MLLTIRFAFAMIAALLLAHDVFAPYGVVLPVRVCSGR